MISVQDAISILQKNISSTAIVSQLIGNAHGFVLAEDVYAPIDMPHFAQSAMDGYVLHFEDYRENEPLPILGEIPAGTTHLPTLLPKTCMRIFTGAPIPQGGDTVIVQEKVRAENGYLYLEDAMLKKGANVRPIASQTAKGDLVIAKGKKLNVGMIALLASLGIGEVKTYQKPRVTVLLTGKELVEIGKPLEIGQVYDSNSYTLTAALQALKLDKPIRMNVGDSLIETEKAITFSLQYTDILIITGGISVGDYDFVQKALENIGVEKLFYKVAQRPGKPFYVGKKADKIIFALPGNPASVHTCFYRYVKPYILEQMGHKNAFLPTESLFLAHSFEKKNALTHFLKAQRLPNSKVKILSHQESYKMNSYVEAEGFVEIVAEKNSYEIGDKVDFFAFD